MADSDLKAVLASFSPAITRKQEIEEILASARAQFETWFAKKYAQEISELAEIDENLTNLHEWFNGELQKRFDAGQHKFLDDTIEPRVLRKAVATDEQEFQKWAEYFPETWSLPNKAEARREAAKRLWQRDRDLLEFDMAAALKLASMTYGDGSPIYEGPFVIESSITKTSLDRLIRLINTFGLEKNFDDRQKADE